MINLERFNCPRSRFVGTAGSVMRLIIAGTGNVGGAFSRIVAEKADWMRKKYGIVPRIVATVDSKGAVVTPNGASWKEVTKARAEGHMTHQKSDARKGATVVDIVEEVEADVLMEFTPTNLKTGQPGLRHIEAAMNKGLSVITTNKGPLAIAMPALLELAQYKNVEFRFSGTVGGGTPVLQLAKECLNGNLILEVEGILNGTTNYILTRMHDAGISLGEALTDAQRLGYAEADPRMDIEGLDTAAKLVILNNWATGGRLSINDVHIEGISKVTANAINEAKRHGEAVKLLGSANGAEASVKPQTIPFASPLCVSGPLNAVSFKTELAGTITLTGHGAGATETAAAALRDLIDIKRMLLD